MKLLLKKKDIWISRRSKHFWGEQMAKINFTSAWQFSRNRCAAFLYHQPWSAVPLPCLRQLHCIFKVGATWFTSSVYYTAAGTLCKYLSENHMMNNTRSLSFRVAIFCHSGTISPWQIYHFSLNVLRYCIGVGTVNSFSQMRLWKNEVYADAPAMERLRSA